MGNDLIGGELGGVEEADPLPPPLEFPDAGGADGSLTTAAFALALEAGAVIDVTAL